MSEKPIHPAAEIFPLMEGDAFAALIADIQEHGLRDPIVLLDGAILDGRNRYRACLEAKVSPRWEQFSGSDPLAFVVSHNLHRRHLNASQRAIVAAQLANIAHGQVGGGHEKTDTEISVSDAAALLNVHHTTVTSARKVLNEGTAEEIEQIKSGNASVSTIARQIRKDESPERRAKRRDETLSQTGKNPERIQRQQINAEVWGRIRDALTHLTSLPQAADVVAIARANDRTGLVDARIQPSLQWLKEFADEWTNAS